MLHGPIGTTEDRCGPSSEILPAELCLSVNETLDIVDYGAGGWSLLLGKQVSTVEFHRLSILFEAHSVTVLKLGTVYFPICSYLSNAR